ncbi:MAG: hypothetical protein ACJA0N_001204 [Pseudohongiellaceae bacterium]|jgi:hypothetical protein
MSDLHAVLYVSSAAKELSPTDVEDLLTRARARNIEHSVTGILLCIGGNFMQYLEGPPSGLEVVYKIIKEDSMHAGLIELMNFDVKKRDFSNWSMAYCTKDQLVIVDDYNEENILNGKLGLLSCKETQARTLLHNFWCKNSP